MEIPQIVALSIFASYFMTILGVGLLILSRLPFDSGRLSRGMPLSFLLYAFLAGVSLQNTWFYMFSYMKWSFDNYESSLSVIANQSEVPLLERVANWLVNTALFEEAWSMVCKGTLNWWWSEQICLFCVGAWNVYLYREGRRRSIPHIWAFMLLAQLVAVSFAANAFWMHISLLPKDTAPVKEKKAANGEGRAPPALWLTTLLGMGSVALTPETIGTRYFLPNLLLFHGILFLPLVQTTNVREPRFSMSFRALYFLTAFLALLLRIRTHLTVFEDAPLQLSGAYRIIRRTLHSNPAQSSIGYDVLWVTISFFVYRIVSQKWAQGVLTEVTGAAAMVAASTGPIAPLLLGLDAADE